MHAYMITGLVAAALCVAIVTGQVHDCGHIDPCNAPYPCRYGDRFPSASNCQYYYQCIAQYEWARVEDDCTGELIFNNATCDCLQPNQGAVCFNHTAICGDEEFDPPDRFNVTAPEPCGGETTCGFGDKDIPDKWMCSRYHTCDVDNGVWVPQFCNNNYYFRPDNNNCNPGIDNCQENPCLAWEVTIGDPGTGIPVTAITNEQQTTLMGDPGTEIPVTTTTTEQQTTLMDAPDITTITSRSTTTEQQTTMSYEDQPCYNGVNPCAPTYPCPLRTRIPIPDDCTSYRHCVALYEWADLIGECKEGFHTPICYCQAGPECFSSTGCTDGGAPPPISTMPPKACAPVGACTEGDSVSDIYYCSVYHNCTDGAWVSSQCPPNHYFNPATYDCTTDIIICGDNACLDESTSALPPF